MVAALGAYLEITFKFRSVKDCGASLTLGPETLRNVSFTAPFGPNA
jgi:hypothetical protein